MEMADNDNLNPPVVHFVEMLMGSDGRLYTREKDTQEETSAFLSTSTTGSSKVYPAVTGKAFRVRTIVIAGALKGKVTLTDGSGTTYIKAMVQTTSTGIIMTMIKGLVFTKSIYAVGLKGADITIAGEIDPLEPST